MIEYPVWAKVFGLATRLEAILRIPMLENHKNELFGITLELRKVLNQIDIHLLRQISNAVQLYTPFALAWLSALGDLKEIVISTGQNTILQLNSRPIRVYQKVGLRPLQAAEFTIASFGIPVVQSRMGGGQLEAFTDCLKRPYGDNLFWYDPVPPARLIVAFLEAADQDPTHQKLYQVTAQRVYQNFGLFPQLQQTTQIPVLNALEGIILKVLFGTASIKDVWHVVEIFGGHV